jgi:hypothetical protein
LDALSESRARVATGIESGLELSEDTDSYFVRVRFNPAACDCPDFELHVFDHWERFYVQGPDAVLQQLERLAGEGSDPTRFLTLKGAIGSGSETASTGVEYRVFEAMAVWQEPVK